MKELLGTLATIVMIVFMVGLVFLFKGEPSLFEVLHQKAMLEARK